MEAKQCICSDSRLARSMYSYRKGLFVVALGAGDAFPGIGEGGGWGYLLTAGNIGVGSGEVDI